MRCLARWWCITMQKKLIDLATVPNATAEDIYDVALHMRPADYAEILVTSDAETREQLASAMVGALSAFKIVKVAYLRQSPVAILAATSLWPGVWVAAMFATDDFRHIKFGVTRLVKRGMIPHVEALGAHRIEAKSHSGHTAAHAWMKICGFRRENGVVEGYGRNGEKFYTFARLTPVKRYNRSPGDGR